MGLSIRAQAGSGAKRIATEERVHVHLQNRNPMLAEFGFSETSRIEAANVRGEACPIDGFGDFRHLAFSSTVA